jgi:hypothetical protein
MLHTARLIPAHLVFIATVAVVGCDLTGDDPEAAYMDDDGDDIGSTSLATTFSDGLTLNSYMNISGSYVRAHCAASKSSRYVRAAGVVQSDWNSYPSESGYHQAWQSVQVYGPWRSEPSATASSSGSRPRIAGEPPAPATRTTSPTARGFG